jgi:hypothetical protein
MKIHLGKIDFFPLHKDNPDNIGDIDDWSQETIFVMQGEYKEEKIEFYIRNYPPHEIIDKERKEIAFDRKNNKQTLEKYVERKKLWIDIHEKDVSQWKISLQNEFQDDVFMVQEGKENDVFYAYDGRVQNTKKTPYVSLRGKNIYITKIGERIFYRCKTLTSGEQEGWYPYTLGFAIKNENNTRTQKRLVEKIFHDDDSETHYEVLTFSNVNALKDAILYAENISISVDYGGQRFYSSDRKTVVHEKSGHARCLAIHINYTQVLVMRMNETWYQYSQNIKGWAPFTFGEELTNRLGNSTGYALHKSTDALYKYEIREIEKSPKQKEFEDIIHKINGDFLFMEKTGNLLHDRKKIGQIKIISRTGKEKIVVIGTDGKETEITIDNMTEVLDSFIE